MTDLLIFIDKSARNMLISTDYYPSVEDTYLLRKDSIIQKNCDPEDYNLDIDGEFPDEIILGPEDTYVFIDTNAEILGESRKTGIISIFSML